LFFRLHSDQQLYCTKKAITKSENGYIKQAKEDIKKDNVIFKCSGGFVIPKYDEKTYKKIDSIKEKYGIRDENTGCTIDEIDSKGQDKYEEIVMPYLEKRNGKGWEKKMDSEIQKLKKVELHSQE
jgi:hypothetical protein